MIKPLVKHHDYLYCRPYNFNIIRGSEISHIRVNSLCAGPDGRLEKVFYYQDELDLDKAIEYFESFLPKALSNNDYKSSLFWFIAIGGLVNLSGYTLYRHNKNFVIFRE